MHQPTPFRTRWTFLTLIMAVTFNLRMVADSAKSVFGNIEDPKAAWGVAGEPFWGKAAWPATCHYGKYLPH